jgi:hypothetical protein
MQWHVTPYRFEKSFTALPLLGGDVFFVFGNAVLFGHVVEPCRHGIVGDSKTVVPRVFD